MQLLEQMRGKAANNPQRIILPEGHDPRIIQAAVKAQDDKIANITLLGDNDRIKTLLRQAGHLTDDITILDNQSDAPQLAKAYYQRRKHKNITLKAAEKAIKDPLNYAHMMLAYGHADGVISGAVNATSEVVRSALQIIGTAANSDLVSSFFIMIPPDKRAMMAGNLALEQPVIFSDCALVIDPDAEQLANIAQSCAENGQKLLGLDPKIAMLSFSTKGSADHHFVDKVNAATQRLQSHYPNLSVDGDLQFDAAIIPEIASRKAPKSTVAGKANIFIFPDLNAGNIAYKIAERIGGFTAIGPILQGLSKPANDLSRGCTANDVYNMIIVTTLQAQIAQAQLT